PEDVLQSVYKSFFARFARGEGRVASVDGWGSLLGLLLVMTARKCALQQAHHRKKRRSIEREQPAPAEEDSSGGVEALAREPTPEEAAIFNDLLGRLVGDLQDWERRVVELGIEGHTVPEIAAAVGWADRTVHRVRDRVRKRLERLLDEGPP